jgi:hypothetical protein
MSSSPPPVGAALSEPTKAEIQQRPWKYIGYKGYASWVASSDTFFHVRKFATLNARVILSLQGEISVLEEKLQELDRIYSSKESGVINNGSFRDDQKTERVETMLSLKQKLLEYSEHYNFSTSFPKSPEKVHLSYSTSDSFINSHSPLRARPPVPKEDVSNSYAWHYNNHGAILDEEQAYITHEDDLMAIHPREISPRSPTQILPPRA